jgi:hypothetical protein
MNELDSILHEATAEIQAGYFQLRVAGEDAPTRLLLRALSSNASLLAEGRMSVRLKWSVDIERDLRKLTRFVKRAHYQRAIFLIYGNEAVDLVERISKIARCMPRLAPIELWLHQHVGQSAERLRTLQGADLASIPKPRLPA